MRLLPFEDLDRWADELARGHSMIVVGERGSGLSTVIDQALESRSMTHTAGVVRVNAQLLGAGGTALKGIAHVCVHQLYRRDAPSRLERLLYRMNLSEEEPAGWQLWNLFDEVLRTKGMPLVVLDRFERLAVRLRPQDWANLRQLYEDHRLQLVLLSRLTLAEIENLTQSPLGQSIHQKVLRPVAGAEELRHLVKDAGGPEGAADEIAALAGGHRSLTCQLARLVASEEGGAGVEASSSVDAAIAAHRDEVLDRLIYVFRGLKPASDPLREELEREFLCAVELAHLPAYTLSLPILVERLERLGHVEQCGGRIRFRSLLLQSVIRRRWFKSRADMETLDSRQAAWLHYDEVLRNLIRQRAEGQSLEGMLEQAGEPVTSILEMIFGIR